MLQLKTKHLLTGEELSEIEMMELLNFGQILKDQKDRGIFMHPLKNKSLVALFEKPSFRTRVSFSLAIQELGGYYVESVNLTRKYEHPRDQAGVLGGMCHAIMVRTFAHKIVEDLAAHSKVPVINALTDLHHPCQAFADILTLRQVFGRLSGLKLAYVGDGNNVLNSLLLLAPYVGVTVSYACPEGYKPNADIVARAKKRAALSEFGHAEIIEAKTAQEAAKNADAIYTDVWTSMGEENTKGDVKCIFNPYQVNKELFALAKSHAIFMHCMPMVLGEEVTEEIAHGPQSEIYRQAENRLHMQKALLVGLVGDDF